MRVAQEVELGPAQAEMAGPADKATPATITLADGVQWPGMNSSVLYRRFFYEPLLHRVLNDFRPFTLTDTERHQVVLCGTPGISKSACGLYLVFRALKLKRTVVYAARKLDIGFVMHADGQVFLFANTRGGALEIPKNDKVWCATG